MYYLVGRFNDKVFVYDSDDGSCELMNMSNLSDSGVVFEEKIFSAPDLYKLCIMYGFHPFGSTFLIKYVNYTVPVIGVESVIVRITLNILPKNKIINDDYVSLWESYGYTGSYIVMMDITPYKYRLENLCHNIGVVGHSLFNGVIIPYVMLNYLMRLKNEQDFGKFESAFDYVFTRDLRLDSSFASFLRDNKRNITDILWGV